MAHSDDSDEVRPKMLGRLNRLAGLAGERDPARIRQRILENLDELTGLCLERERTYVTKDGDERSYADPDLKTALSAQLAGARILGADESAGIGASDAEHVDALVRKARRVIAAKQAAESGAAASETH
jgi:hypothetical protein